MLKRILSVCLSLMLILGTLGSLTLTVSAATVSENIRWSEDFTNASSTRKNNDRMVAFDTSYTWLKGSDDNFVFCKEGGGYGEDESFNVFATYIEDFKNNKMLHYNPTVNAGSETYKDSKNNDVAKKYSISLERTFGTGGAGINVADANNGKTAFVWSTVSDGTTYATSGAWNFSFDFYPVNSNEKLIFSTFGNGESANEKSLFVYENGTAQLLNNTASVSLANGVWHRFNFAADGNGKIEAYINGVKVAESNTVSYWSQLRIMIFKFNGIENTIGEYYLDNFKVSDQATGFFGTGSAFDCTVTNSLGFEIKDTASDGGATSTVVIGESEAANTTAQAFCDSLTLASAAPDAAPVLYDTDGNAIEDDYEDVKMNRVSKMVVDTGYASREYKIFVEVETFASSSYDVDHADKTISGVKENTKVKDFIDALSPISGATLKVKNGSAELEDDALITDGATLVSIYNGEDFTYDIEFAKYWTEDFTTVSGVQYWGTNDTNYPKDSSGAKMFEASRFVYRISTGETTQFYYVDETKNGTVLKKQNYTENWLGSSYYYNGVYNHFTNNGYAWRSYLHDFDSSIYSDFDIKIQTKLKHILKSDGKSSGTPVTTDGAYNFEFSLYPKQTNFEFDVKGIKTDNSEFSFIKYNKGEWLAFGNELNLSGVTADAEGFYNFKIEYFGNGIADVTVNGTKVGSNLTGGSDIVAVLLDTMSYFEYGVDGAPDYATEYYIDNIDLYPVAYEAPATATAIALYKDSVAEANKVTGKAQLASGTKYIARADVSCYDASLPTMLVIAVYKDNALSKVNAGTKTFTYGQTDGFDEVELAASDVEGADRVCVFLWNGTTLKPYKSIEIK